MLNVEFMIVEFSAEDLGASDRERSFAPSPHGNNKQGERGASQPRMC